MSNPKIQPLAIWSTLVVVAVTASPVLAMQQADSRAGAPVSEELTVEKLENFLQTHAEFAALARQRPASTGEGLEGLSNDETVTFLESNASAREILAKLDWTARDYVDTWTAVGKALIVIDLLESREVGLAPTAATEANIRFLSSLPEDLSERFLSWKRTEIDPVLRRRR